IRRSRLSSPITTRMSWSRPGKVVNFSFSSIPPLNGRGPDAVTSQGTSRPGVPGRQLLSSPSGVAERLPPPGSASARRRPPAVRMLRSCSPRGRLSGRLVGVRVLGVEDERRLAAAVKRGLEAEGFVVDLAHDGVTGLHMAREGSYDSVVLDIMLPGMSGYKVCQELRAAENWVPVLVLSAKDGEYDQADALDLGADDYLTKPLAYVVLAARLRALLRRGVVPRPSVLRCGDLTLDPASREVRRGSVRGLLTAREFALLEYLIRQARSVR